MTWSWAIPGAVVAIYTLVTAVPATHRRRCAVRAELLSKLVAAAGDDCPKALRAEMIEKINWVAAYSAIRYTGKYRLIVWIGWPVSMIFPALFATAVTVLEAGPGAGSVAAILGAAFSLACILGLQLIPVTIVMDWMYARRLLYVKVGGRDGFADLRFPGLRRRGYTSGVVKRLTTQVFGGRTRGTAVSDGDLLALRRAMSEWEKTPMPWPRRAPR